MLSVGGLQVLMVLASMLMLMLVGVSREADGYIYVTPDRPVKRKLHEAFDRASHLKLKLLWLGAYFLATPHIYM